MPTPSDREQFTPPPPPGRLPAVLLAVLMHAVLLTALAWGVQWKASAAQPAVQAELWAALPQQTAPRAEMPPPAPAPAPPPPSPAPPPQAAPDTHDAEIAIERQKKRLERERKQRQDQQEREKRDRERQERLAQEKKERLQKEKTAQEKAAREKVEREQAEQEKQAQQKKQAEDKRKAEAQARQLEVQRQENLRRMQGLAGATGSASATGKDLRNAGPSGSYGGKVVAKVKPNIVYPDEIAGNPRAEVEVRTAPDGTIVGTRLLQSSGNKAWDEAVLRALQKTDTLPRDIDGRVPPSLVIGFRPRD